MAIMYLFLVLRSLQLIRLIKGCCGGGVVVDMRRTAAGSNKKSRPQREGTHLRSYII